MFPPNRIQWPIMCLHAFLQSPGAILSDIGAILNLPIIHGPQVEMKQSLRGRSGEVECGHESCCVSMYWISPTTTQSPALALVMCVHPQAIIAGTLYISCRYGDVPRTLKGNLTLSSSCITDCLMHLLCPCCTTVILCCTLHTTRILLYLPVRCFCPISACLPCFPIMPSQSVCVARDCCTHSCPSKRDRQGAIRYVLDISLHALQPSHPCVHLKQPPIVPQVCLILVGLQAFNFVKKLLKLPDLEVIKSANYMVLCSAWLLPLQPAPLDSYIELFRGGDNTAPTHLIVLFSGQVPTPC